MAAIKTNRSFVVAVACHFGNQFCKYFLVALVAAAVLLVYFSSDADAARRRGRRSRSRKAAAEPQTAMSQTQVDQALSQLSRMQYTIEAAHMDAQNAAKTLHQIEPGILAEQSSDSDWGRAQETLEQAKRELHRVIHVVGGLPYDSRESSTASGFADLAKLSPADREALERDRRYQAAQRDLAEAEQMAHENSKRLKTSGISSLPDRQDLRKVEKVAAQARAVIQRGEAQLRA